MQACVLVSESQSDNRSLSIGAIGVSQQTCEGNMKPTFKSPSFLDHQQGRLHRHDQRPTTTPQPPPGVQHWRTSHFGPKLRVSFRLSNGSDYEVANPSWLATNKSLETTTTAATASRSARCGLLTGSSSPISSECKRLSFPHNCDELARISAKMITAITTAKASMLSVTIAKRTAIYLTFLCLIFLPPPFTVVNCQMSTRSSDNQAFGCPYPGVGSNCQVNIVAQAPAVPLLSTDYVSDEYATLKPDTQASYKCDQGYELLGQETLTCLQSGRWSGQAPSCVTNIAPGKPTNQSSTVKGGDSRNANDGRVGTQHDGRHCTETRVDQSPWWQIDLMQLYEIRSVRLLGRACCNPQLSLHDMEIRVGNSSTIQGNRLCAWYPNNLDEGVARDFQCAHPIVGRFVSIQMVGIEAALSLCEVMVFSTKEFPADRCSIQTTLAPSNTKPQQVSTATTTSATTTQSSNGQTTAADNQLVVFNRTCYEMQTTNGGSFLVADTYCKARGGSLLHSVNNLTQSFISQELERMKTKLKSKLVWLGAKRETSSSNAAGVITPGSTSALVPPQEGRSSRVSARSVLMALDEFSPSNLFSGDQAGESSPIFSPLTAARSSLYQISSGAGGSTSRGSQTFGLPTTGIQHATVANRSTIEHPQRSLIISQPNQIASFFTPPVPVTNNNNPTPLVAIQSPALQPSPPSAQPIATSPINFQSTPHVHRSLRPPALATTSTSAPSVASSSPQLSWIQSAATSPSTSQSNWRWVGDSQSGTLMSLVNSGGFLWAEDQPNNYNNQQDCIVLDGGKRWLWNDVTCELDYLPWVCQYRPSTCGSPDRNENSTILELPSTPDGVTVQEQAYQFGKTVTYACPVGHRLDGPRQRRCQYDGTWSGKAPKCQYVNCGLISSQPVENGRTVYLNQSQTTFGSQVKYVCYEDYVLVGSDLRQCQAEGKWDGKQPYCAYKWCPVLHQIPNGFLNVSSYSENSIAFYQCNSGYKLIGNDTRQCLLGGKWTNQEPFCQYVDCGQPKQIANGNYQLLNSTTNYLSVVTYSCHDNYTLVGNNNRMICSHNNRWTGKEPQCSLIDCGQPQASSGSSFSGDSFTVHSKVDYKCDPGFKEISGSTQRTCGLDGQWTGQPITCKYVDCGRVPGILKGEVSYINGTTYLASQVAYECTAGNRLSGHRVRFCGPDGRWTGSSPKCEEVRCDAPQLPANGSAIYIGNDRSFKEQSFSVGVTVQYECDYGHVVRGSWSSRLCQANGEWSGEAPVCKFVDCGQPPNIDKANGNYQLLNSTTNYLSVVTYSCHDNYTLVGNNNRMICSHNNRWTGKEPQCSLIDCGQPQASSGSSFSGDSFTVHSKVDYKCDPGFKEISGSTQRTCGLDGQWTGQPITCKYVDCGRVPGILKGEVSYINGTTYLASQVAYECTAGNRLSGHRVRFCGPDGRWTGSSPKCEEVRCDAPQLPANGSAIYIGNDRSFKEQSFSVGVTVQYECDYGHVVRGSWSSRLCQANGEWSGEAPVCKFVDCGQPPNIDNGNYVLKHPPSGSVGTATPVESTRRSDSNSNQATSGTFTYYGTIAHYSCEPSFKLQGQAQRECLDSGQWRTPLPTCEPVQCPKPEHFDEFTQVSLVARSVDHGTGDSIAISSTPSSSQLVKSIRLIANNQWLQSHEVQQQQAFGLNDKLHYSCVPGYELYGGPEIRTCTQYGQWSGSSTPRCRLIDCGRPAPIGQEGRFYLLNESTTFNSLVEYSCVRPFRLVEVKIRQAGNLIETLQAAQAGVTPILTALPIGVKVCANNGQWMPNDQQPKCLSPGQEVPTASAGSGQFDGADNSLDGSQRVHQVAPGNLQTTFNSNSNIANQQQDVGLDSNNLAGLRHHHHHHHHLNHQQQQTTTGGSSIWAKVVIAICLMVMLALIILTLICIRSGKKPKQVQHTIGGGGGGHHRTSILANSPNGHHPQSMAAAASAAMQLQMAAAAANGKQQQQVVAAAAAQQLMSGQNIYINGASKMFPANMMSQTHHLNALGGQYGNAIGQGGPTHLIVAGAGRPGDIMLANGKSSSLGMMRGSSGGEQLAMSSTSAGGMLDTYSRLSIESEAQQANSSKTIRHNPNGLVTFVSPAQQQQQQLNRNQATTNGASSQQHHQVSPQSISTSLSMSSSSSPSSSSSAHHTTATRLSASASDSASSSSSSSQSRGGANNDGYQVAQPQAQYAQPQPQASPPSLPAHPPPPHRLQQHHKQLLKQQAGRQQQQQQQQTNQQQQSAASNHHYMEPTI